MGTEICDLSTEMCDVSIEKCECYLIVDDILNKIG